MAQLKIRLFVMAQHTSNTTPVKITHTQFYRHTQAHSHTHTQMHTHTHKHTQTHTYTLYTHTRTTGTLKLPCS